MNKKEFKAECATMSENTLIETFNLLDSIGILIKQSYAHVSIPDPIYKQVIDCRDIIDSELSKRG